MTRDELSHLASPVGPRTSTWTEHARVYPYHVKVFITYRLSMFNSAKHLPSMYNVLRLGAGHLRPTPGRSVRLTKAVSQRGRSGFFPIALATREEPAAGFGCGVACVMRNTVWHSILGSKMRYVPSTRSFFHRRPEVDRVGVTRRRPERLIQQRDRDETVNGLGSRGSRVRNRGQGRRSSRCLCWECGCRGCHM